MAGMLSGSLHDSYCSFWFLFSILCSFDGNISTVYFYFCNGRNHNVIRKQNTDSQDYFKNTEGLDGLNTLHIHSVGFVFENL